LFLNFVEYQIVTNSGFFKKRKLQYKFQRSPGLLSLQGRNYLINRVILDKKNGGKIQIESAFNSYRIQFS